MENCTKYIILILNIHIKYEDWAALILYIELNHIYIYIYMVKM